MKNATLGQVIAEARKKKLIAQNILAEKITKDEGGSISAQYLNDIERDRRVPSRFILKELAKELSIDSDYLFSLAEKLPEDIKEQILKSDLETVVHAYKVFRKNLKK